LAKFRILLPMTKYKSKVDLALFIPIMGVMLGATSLTVILPLKQPDQTGQLVGFGRNIFKEKELLEKSTTEIFSVAQ
jgi:hypothetical protein